MMLKPADQIQSEVETSYGRSTAAGHDDEETQFLDMRPNRGPGENTDSPAARDRRQLRLASWAFTTRRVPTGSSTAILPFKGSPEVGDLILARVDLIGHHGGLQLVNGRRRHMFPGDEIVVAYGNRYASSQFEAEIPETFGPCHLVAGGGIASRAICWHAKISRGPTQITPIGMIGDIAGYPINLKDYALAPFAAGCDFEPTCIAVVGTAMDSGKTQTCVHLVRGLVAAGLRVGYVKVTGTGAGGDIWWLKDAGADPVVDFTDVGMPSTYLAPHDVIESALTTLIAHVSMQGVDAIVVEIADGVLQRETAVLLNSDVFAKTIGGIVLAAQDAMGASAGTSWLERQPTPVLALSGILTAAPLQVVEASNTTGLPIFDRAGLASPENALKLLGLAQHYLSRSKRPAREIA